MESVLRVLAGILGIALIILFFLSLARTAILNRRSSDPILRSVTRFDLAIIKAWAGMRQGRGDVEQVYAWYMPLFILTIIVAWFGIVLVAFMALYWALRAEPSLFEAAIASGSALTTLGFHTPSTPHGEALAVFQGAIGLVIVVFILTFVPGYQSAIQTRELKTAWLYRRLGPRPNGTAMLLWLHQHMAAVDQEAFWDDWESWFRQMRASSVASPQVAVTPSSFPGQSWVSSAHAILDAAALRLAAIEGRSAAAEICAETGVDAIRAIGATLAFDASRQSALVEAVMRTEFDAALDQLEAGGLAVVADREAAWSRFAALNAEYSATLKYVSEQTLTQDDLRFSGDEPA